MPRSVYCPLRQKSHSSTAQLAQGTGSGRRTIPTTRSPLTRSPPAGASSTRPRDSCPRTSRWSPGGAHPYAPEQISRSVPHTPMAMVSTSTGPSDSGGSGMSVNSPLSALRGTTVRAFTRLFPSVRPRGPRSASRSFALLHHRFAPPEALHALEHRRGGVERVHQHPSVLGGRRQRIAPAETEGRVDQGHMREGLREVADHPSGERVVFLRKETELIAQREQALEQFDRILLAADHVEAVDEPERTGQERPLPAREPIDRSVVIGAVAQHEAVIDQVALDGFDRRNHPL